MTAEIKAEILTKIPGRRCCQESFLETWYQQNGENALFYSTPSMARYLIMLLRGLQVSSWGIGQGLQRKGKIILSEQAIRMFASKSFLHSNSRCCQKIFLKTLFLSRGSFSLSKGGYHLELHGMNKSQAQKALEVSEALGVGGSLYFRRNQSTLYYKDGDHIARFLGIIGAVKTLLRFEEHRALKETKNKIRRQVNYETANLIRVADASALQQETIKRLMKGIRWKSLSPNLKIAAMARLQYPSLSLRELAGKLQMTKSALNHRLRRLEEFSRTK